MGFFWRGMMSLRYQLFLILLSFRGLESLEEASAVDSAGASEQPKQTNQILGDTSKDEELLPPKPSNSYHENGTFRQLKNTKPGKLTTPSEGSGKPDTLGSRPGVYRQYVPACGPGETGPGCSAPACVPGETGPGCSEPGFTNITETGTDGRQVKIHSYNIS